jgi:short-subunit dehydrogenase
MARKDPQRSGKAALITGASSGIGRELAELFAADGHDVVLAGRSTAELESLATQFIAEHGVHAVAITIDLFKPEAPQQLYDEVKRQGFTIDYLVNDAGQGLFGKFADTDLNDELQIMQLNMNALVVLTKLYLRDMLARDQGRILQLASSVSKMPSPYQAVYAGTKAFVYNFTQSIIDEIKGSKVTITALRPGATETDFFEKAGAQDSKIVQKDKMGPADKVARDGYEALMSGRSAIVSGIQNKLMDAVGNLTPDQALAAGMRKMSEPAHK